MQPSMELRWFLHGALRDDLRVWFETSNLSRATGDFKPNTEERQDSYLILPHRTDLGIKLRRGETIEIKQRLEDRGVRALDSEAKGRLEQWVKWSFRLIPEDVSPSDASFLGPSWIDVHKIRRTRKFAISSANLVAEIEPNSNCQGIPEGCNLELTSLRVRNQIWHSLGFEAFGKKGTVEKNLMLVLSEIKSHSQFPPLNARDSFAYPEWLRKVS